MSTATTDRPAPALGPTPSGPSGAGGTSLASPDVLGLWAFAAGTFLGNLPDTGLVEGGGLSIVTAVLVAGLLQLLAGLAEYRTRNLFGATAFTAFGVFWIEQGVVTWLGYRGLLPATGPTATGWYLVTWTVFAVVLTVATLTLSRAVTVTVALSAVGLAAKAAGVLADPTACTRIGAWVLVACAVAALYTATAQFWNASLGRTVLPLGERPDRTAEATGS